MGIFEKIKKVVNVPEEDYFDDMNSEDAYESYEDDDEFEQESNDVYSSSRRRNENDTMKVVDMQSAARPHLVFKKLDSFEGVAEVADVLNEKRIVILNLETCANDAALRILDFLSGVAYANHGEVKRVAGRAYVVTPHNFPVTGELLDELGGKANEGYFD
jgi:cell division inhibitor SepF